MQTTKLYQLSEYKAPNYFMTHVDLEIDLAQQPELSKSKLTIIPNPDVEHLPDDLQLDGEFMLLSSVKLNGRLLDENEYLLTADSLIIKNVPKKQTFYIETSCILSQSTDLFGLYKTDDIYLVKAETEGLRRVFFCIDRPDNLATYTTTIIANQQQYPVLLCNGALVHEKTLDDGLHCVTWHDALPKPSYLFALVAGNLNYSATLFKTRNGRCLPIEFYVSSKDILKCQFAQEVLKKAIAWDESAFSLDCDLAQHMVAGVDKYASGASEPTGLNLFNTENLFASPEIKTDLGMLRVLEVVAHEFFHYWTGNRVTIRDWFNLTFKEGLTTFRAAMFCEDLFGTDLARLLNGKNLDNRAPRQSSYNAVRSLYTTAAYEKGADIFRMMMLVVGKELFYKSLSAFLKEYDGKAVTIEEILQFLSTATSINLNAFLPWFTEPGTPRLTISDNYDSEQQHYELKIKLNEKNKPIPLLMGLLDHTGKELIEERLLLIDMTEMVFEFSNMATRPIPSLLRSFSAPIYLSQIQSNDDLLVLIQHDSNLYNRCEAAKKLILNLVNEYCTNTKINYPQSLFSVYRSLINDKNIEPWILAELLTISSEEELIAGFEKPQFELLAAARQQIHKTIAEELKNDWPQLLERIKNYSPNSNPQFALFDIKDAGMRRLNEVYYSYYQHIDFAATQNALVEQFQQQLSRNMSETISSLSLLAAINSEQELNDALNEFYSYWKDDTNAINYWFRIQASIHSNNVVSRVEHLLNHPAFDILNPNKIYSLFSNFIINPYGFHNNSGDGYKLVSKIILVLDKLNPPLAANLTQSLTTWEKYDGQRRKLMFACLTFIYKEAISTDVKNTARKGITAE